MLIFLRLYLNKIYVTNRKSG